VYNGCFPSSASGVLVQAKRGVVMNRSIVWSCSVMILLTGFLPEFASASSEPAEVASASEVILLWPEGAPGAKGNAEADKPTLTVYHPPKNKATGTAVVICPGGGYSHLAINHEGHQVAQWLNTFGVAGIVLKYRHRKTGYQHPAPLQDAQRALRTVRHRATEWNINPQRVGILGFSAGGHLASTAGTHFDHGSKAAVDPVERISCRPDFMVLIYPVISFSKPYTHRGSRKNLLGESPDQVLVDDLSNENKVTAETPPTFLIHTSSDRSVPCENSLAFFMALRDAGVPSELHVFVEGRHGFGLGQKDAPVSHWPKLCEAWMRGRGLLSPAEVEKKS